MFESLFITSIAGYLGLVIGTGILSYASSGLEKYFIKDPQVDVMNCNIRNGLVDYFRDYCGLIPARKASKIKPIVALNDD